VRSAAPASTVAAPCTLERAVDMGVLQTARRALTLAMPKSAPRLSVNDFLLQAVARTLLDHPALIDAPAGAVRVGLVVAADDEVATPVLHGVEQLGLAEIARRRADVVERARAGRLDPAELEGAVFGILNLGAAGPDRCAAPVEPPLSALLAVSRQREVVVARAGVPQVRPVCEISLSLDPRGVDVRRAVQFLTSLCARLEGEDWFF